MSGERLKDDVQSTYRCGNCRQDIFYLATEEPPVPCPECGWFHTTKRITDVPPEVKLDLTQY